MTRITTRLALVGGLTLALVAGGGLAVAGVIGALPGGEDKTVIGESRSHDGIGTQTVVLDPVPRAANKIRVELTCLSAGTFEFPANAGSMGCDTDDVGQAGDWASVEIPLADVDGEVTVTASSGERWRVTITFLNAVRMPLGVNANGDSYGVGGGPEGEPDLVAVVADNGHEGYVYAAELADADGTTAGQSFRTPADALEWQERQRGVRHVVPVYLEDGETKIGEYTIG
ncbi:hypothetical protein BKA24_001531 [Microbacterium marinum]|uniref:Uncharacterized protein n=1 Tax=Microbacterium marinum TaxID=421115 RepID=A0A7W7BQ87_9MICO|nr:peptidase M56 family protein [Microbacterium marinum]MBB4666822.1 hypothetical protein [Microbacterium marinum]